MATVVPVSMRLTSSSLPGVEWKGLSCRFYWSLSESESESWRGGGGVVWKGGQQVSGLCGAELQIHAPTWKGRWYIEGCTSSSYRGHQVPEAASATAVTADGGRGTGERP